MFGTSGIRGPVGETVTAQTALAVGRALASDGADWVVVGRDLRETGPMLIDAASAGPRVRRRYGGAGPHDAGTASPPPGSGARGRRSIGPTSATRVPPARPNGSQPSHPIGVTDERKDD